MFRPTCRALSGDCRLPILTRISDNSVTEMLYAEYTKTPDLTSFKINLTRISLFFGKTLELNTACDPK